MIPSRSILLQCPNCPAVFQGRAYSVYSRYVTQFFSDLEAREFSTADLPPAYGVCTNCGKVAPGAVVRIASQQNEWRVQSARFMPVDIKQAYAALVDGPAPFLHGSAEAHLLRLWLWRKLGDGSSAPALDGGGDIRVEIVRTLKEEFEARCAQPVYTWSSGVVQRLAEEAPVPVYRFLLAELHRRSTAFEQARAIFEELQRGEGTDALPWYSQQQVSWCNEKDSRRKLLIPPMHPKPRARRAYKFIALSPSPGLGRQMSQWVPFPGGGDESSRNGIVGRCGLDVRPARRHCRC